MPDESGQETQSVNSGQAEPAPETPATVEPVKKSKPTEVAKSPGKRFVQDKQGNITFAKPGESESATTQRAAEQEGDTGTQQ